MGDCVEEMTEEDLMRRNGRCGSSGIGFGENWRNWTRMGEGKDDGRRRGRMRNRMEEYGGTREMDGRKEKVIAGRMRTGGDERGEMVGKMEADSGGESDDQTSRMRMR